MEECQINYESENKIEEEVFYNSYKVIKLFEKTKRGELYLVLKNGQNYLLYKIEIKSKAEKEVILDEIKVINSLNSKYVIQINDHFENVINKREYYFLIIDYYKNGNLFDLMKRKYFFNYRMIWRIFIQIVLGIKSFHDKGMTIKRLYNENIYFDNEMNIKIGGYGTILDFTKKENINAFELYSPEILNGKDFSKKSDTWLLGCILYEMFFKEKPFKLQNNIFDFNYKIGDNCDEDLKHVLSKLLCDENKRFLTNELLNDKILNKKILEVNLFDEIVKDNIKSK